MVLRNQSFEQNSADVGGAVFYQGLELDFASVRFADNVALFHSSRAFSYHQAVVLKVFDGRTQRHELCPEPCGAELSDVKPGAAMTERQSLHFCLQDEFAETVERTTDAENQWLATQQPSISIVDASQAPTDFLFYANGQRQSFLP